MAAKKRSIVMFAVLGVAACRSDPPPPVAVPPPSARIEPVASAPPVASSAPPVASSAAPVASSAPPVVAKDERGAPPVSCKTDDDCWVDGKTPIARPPQHRGKKLRPCKDAEKIPVCADGVCAVRAYKC